MDQPTNLVLHPLTLGELERLVHSKPHAIILEAPGGSGKHSLVTWLAAELAGNPDAARALQQVLFIDRGEDKSVKIDKVRRVEQFLMRKMPGDVWRVVVIESAETMSGDAQNALLKTLEEPPANTTIVLVANAITSLLPTVRSRAVKVTLKRPPADTLKTHFIEQGHAAKDVDRAHLMSGGLPGLMHSILSSESAHPMLAAADTARQVIQGTRFTRLAMVDALSKQREQAVAVCQILQQMAHLRLQIDPLAAQWQRILQSSYTAEEQLYGSALPKLVLTELMLSL